mgnify:CR=1 FL=1
MKKILKLENLKDDLYIFKKYKIFRELDSCIVDIFHIISPTIQNYLNLKYITLK